eukprot:m.507808 g.507808  ORF g.507808 m.507808 type:complete len:101 (-) comp86824_c0_seq1:93-395(-)
MNNSSRQLPANANKHNTSNTQQHRPTNANGPTQTTPQPTPGTITDPRTSTSNAEHPAPASAPGTNASTPTPALDIHSTITTSPARGTQNHSTTQLPITSA